MNKTAAQRRREFVKRMPRIEAHYEAAFSAFVDAHRADRSRVARLDMRIAKLQHDLDIAERKIDFYEKGLLRLCSLLPELGRDAVRKRFREVGLWREPPKDGGA